MKDYYAALEVDKSATLEEISQSYRKLALKYHPDVSKEEDATVKFKEIAEAYETLGDAEKRAAYDNPYSRMDQNSFDPFSIFGFGNRTSKLDINYNQTISFKESIVGCNKVIELPKKEKCNLCNSGIKSSDTCTTCKGSGKIQQKATNGWFVQTDCQTCHRTGKINIVYCECDKGYKTVGIESIDVEIPAGVVTNSLIRMGGKGNKVNNQVGNLNVIITVEPHQNITRMGNNLLYRVWCPAHVMFFGGKIELVLFDSKFEVSIPPKTQSASKIRLRNQGVNGGDLFVIVNLDVNSLQDYLQPLENDVKQIDYSNLVTD